MPSVSPDLTAAAPDPLPRGGSAHREAARLARGHTAAAAAGPRAPPRVDAGAARHWAGERRPGRGAGVTESHQRAAGSCTVSPQKKSVGVLTPFPEKATFFGDGVFTEVVERAARPLGWPDESAGVSHSGSASRSPGCRPTSRAPPPSSRGRALPGGRGGAAGATSRARSPALREPRSSRPQGCHCHASCPEASGGHLELTWKGRQRGEW